MPKVIKLTLCQSGCCPTVEMDTETNMVIIKDDEGGKVSLTTGQFQILLDQGRYINGES